MNRPYDAIKTVPRNRNMRKENAVFPRQRAGGAIPFLSVAVFCVVPTVNFAQQNLKAEARCDEALGGEQNGEYLRLYLQL